MNERIKELAARGFKPGELHIIASDRQTGKSILSQKLQAYHRIGQLSTMNKRIKELYNKVVGDDKLNFDSYLAEKFAQLIVQECASRVTSKADRWGNMTDEIINECIIECATDLKQHFGVEE